MKLVEFNLNDFPDSSIKTYYMTKEEIAKKFPGESGQLEAAIASSPHSLVSVKKDLIAEGWSIYEPKRYSFADNRIFAMKKDNFIMNVDIRGSIPYFQIILRDPSLWMDKIHNPEHWRVTLRCNSIEEFRQLEKLLNN